MSFLKQNIIIVIFNKMANLFSIRTPKISIIKLEIEKVKFITTRLKKGWYANHDIETIV
jgi:hypothetical protein